MHLSDHDTLVSKYTLLGQWLGRKLGTTGPKYIDNFLQMTSTLGNTFLDCIPNILVPRGQTVKRGQTVLQDGTAIMAKRQNMQHQRKDADGNKLPDGEYHLVRASMGAVGGKTDRRCKEFLSPALPLVHRVLSAWPQKLKELPNEVSKAFDGSKRLSYLNMLVTLGGIDKDSHVASCVANNPTLANYVAKDAGTWIHNDESNTPGTPCVAIMLGAYEGFNFAFPTCGVEIAAPSGTIVVASMRDLIHAVGGGVGLRITLVFCQHEEASNGVMRHKTVDSLVLSGARSSITDRKKIAEGEVVPTIAGLDKYEFV
jgi:hypothetical protein